MAPPSRPGFTGTGNNVVRRSGRGRARCRCGGGCLLLVSLDDPGDAQELVPWFKSDKPHAFGAAVRLTDATYRAPDTLAFRCQQHDFVAVADAQRASEPHGTILGQIDRPHAA